VKELLQKILRNSTLAIKYIWKVIVDTTKAVFTDPGVVVIFVVACLAYPILYNFIYLNNSLTDVPIAVVDRSGCAESVTFIRKLDDTPDVRVEYKCTSMKEAEALMRAQKIHGIIYFPSEYEACIEAGKGVAHISLYCDMTSFLYMKSVYMAANMVMLDEMHNIQLDRYQKMGMTEETTWTLIQAAPYEEVKLYNETDGYGTFLIPSVLVLIIHQTLFFGICMLRGTYYEEKKNMHSVRGHKWIHALLITIGMGIAFLLIYLGLGTFDLIIVPRIFNLPHIGSAWSVLQFMVPFILATTFFSITISSFIHNRETGMVLLLSTSLIFLFISGVSWPQPSIPIAWKYLSYFFPSTWGIHAYIHINSMGATITETIKEINSLWILSGVYFLTSAIGFYHAIKANNAKK